MTSMINDIQVINDIPIINDQLNASNPALTGIATLSYFTD